MRKNIKTLFAITLMSVFSFAALSQTPFSGIIKYKISTEGRELSAQEKAQMPSEQTLYISGSLIKTENITAMGGVSTIVDTATGSTILLYDMMGQKIAFKGEKNDTTEEKLLEPEIKELDESKTILGYKCKKYEIKLENGTIEAFITNDIDVKDPMLSSMKGIKGFMMEFSQTSKEDEDLILNYIVTEINKGKVKKSIFKIPKGYEVKTFEDLQNMMGG